MLEKINETTFKANVINDYRIAVRSREASLLGRKEVLTGKAKFGIFGDGKELPQIALSKVFKPGDFRSGYYRDQTFMIAINRLTIQAFFAQLYAHTHPEKEPATAGRSMNGHYATQLLDENGDFLPMVKLKNSSADISPTAGQMGRLVGLAQASKIYRHNSDLKDHSKKFSNQGQEIAFATIGDASTSEGSFFEAVNAIGVLQVPAIISVWDDGYGISVENKYQTTKSNISEILKGFQRSKNKKDGYEILTAKAWNYKELIRVYKQAETLCREQHCPVLVHITEVTQPQGHSTSGSHERYKSKERLEWENTYCCIKQFKHWILEKNIANDEELNLIEKEAKLYVKDSKQAAWNDIIEEVQIERKQCLTLTENILNDLPNETLLNTLSTLKNEKEPLRKAFLELAKTTLRTNRFESTESLSALKDWLENMKPVYSEKYNSHLLSEYPSSPLNIASVLPDLSEEKKDGRIILRDNFDQLFSFYPELLTFGEDSGKIGGVNQSLEGLQSKYGELRVSDTGIREHTIIGQGIGLAMRGLRPIAEIQYLDYLLYGIQILSDDLATLAYRTKGKQKAPLIVRTRGHRLEGIWHSGSPMGMIINAVRGMHVCVPRNMTEAAGFYNLLLQGDDPAIVIEPLNGYRTKELVPKNLGKFTTPLGIPNIITAGDDLTIVSYGSTLNLVIQAQKELNELGIYPEIIDIRTLLPFDIKHLIRNSIKKTSKLLVVDEDVPGGASAFILQHILEEQKGYYLLDEEPQTLTAKAHRPAYGSDGDYFSKPSVSDVIDKVYSMMSLSSNHKFPNYY